MPRRLRPILSCPWAPLPDDFDAVSLTAVREEVFLGGKGRWFRIDLTDKTRRFQDLPLPVRVLERSHISPEDVTFSLLSIDRSTTPPQCATNLQEYQGGSWGMVILDGDEAEYLPSPMDPDIVRTSRSENVVFLAERLGRRGLEAQTRSALEERMAGLLVYELGLNPFLSNTLWGYTFLTAAIAFGIDATRRSTGLSATGGAVLVQALELSDSHPQSCGLPPSSKPSSPAFLGCSGLAVSSALA